MKEKPSLQDKLIADRLHEVYGFEVAELEFLPIGDISSAKYRVVTNEPAVYFLKLRRNGFKAVSVIVPYFLHELGIHQVISPLKTTTGQLWTQLDAYTCILYPFVEGHNGFQNHLSDDQWREFGALLRSIHSVNLPPGSTRKVPFETFSPFWRDQLKGVLLRAETNLSEDPLAAKMAEGLQQHRDEIQFVIERAESLGKALQPLDLDQVLCHSDIHAGNLLLERNGALHVTDWDDPLMAPKERDLMFIGGGIGGIWNTPREEALFYQGYGNTDINLTALAYYRFERIVSDIAEFGQQLIASTQDDADRERSLHKFFSVFLPNQIWEIACRTG